MGGPRPQLRATVAQLVPVPRRATAHGMYAAVIAAGTVAGGALTGALYQYFGPALIITVVAVQSGALVLLAVGRSRRSL